MTRSVRIRIMPSISFKFYYDLRTYVRITEFETLENLMRICHISQKGVKHSN